MCDDTMLHSVYMGAVMKTVKGRVLERGVKMVKVAESWSVWNLMHVNYTVLLPSSEMDLESLVGASCAEVCVCCCGY